ncbi:hypothetical protein DFAR_760003 [Desulfarculales bacterium]
MTELKQEAIIDTGELLALGLGSQPLWRLVEQRVGTDKKPQYGKLCKAHDFHEFTWLHLNLFQHHCYVTARVPRARCPDHGSK